MNPLKDKRLFYSVNLIMFILLIVMYVISITLVWYNYSHKLVYTSNEPLVGFYFYNEYPNAYNLQPKTDLDYTTITLLAKKDCADFPGRYSWCQRFWELYGNEMNFKQIPTYSKAIVYTAISLVLLTTFYIGVIKILRHIILG